MREVEVNLIFAADALPLEAYLKYFAGRDVARNKVPVGGIFFLEKIVAFIFRNVARAASVGGVSRHPNTSAFAAGRFAHQPKFVLTGDGSRMHLDEFAVRVSRTLLVTGGHSTSRA